MISPGELTALLIAITGLLAAIGGLYAQIRVLTKRVDGRLSQLLALTEKAAKAEGVLEATSSTSTSSSASSPNVLA